MTHHIALYGKGGVGKTTLAANISASLVEAGFSVAQVDCNADGDSCSLPNPDYVFHEVSGDTCSALNTVIAQADIMGVFVVTTADFKALQVANEVFGFLEQYNSEANVPIPMGGLILNNIASSFEEVFVKDFAYHTYARIIGKVPRSLVVRQCELQECTVIESQPRSNQSYYYRRLANRIVDATGTIHSGNQPRPMSAERLRAWSLEWADRIYALENGLVTDGAAI